jgi:hypothetical protein
MKQAYNPWRICWSLVGFAAAFIAIPQLAVAVVPVVKTVPVDPANAATAHTACPSTLITLKGTSDQQGATIMYDWDFGDGSAHATGIVTNRYDVQATHTYTGSNLQNFTAILKITDTLTSDHASKNYPVQMVNPCNLAARANIAIDEGLWYLHKIMWRTTSGATAGSAGSIPIGGWDIQPGSPGACVSGAFQDLTLGTAAFAGCDNIQSASVITDNNIQAFEVNGHLESGPASDPYTDDVARGLARAFQFLRSGQIAKVTITFVNAACPVPNCLFDPDSNGNGIGLFSDVDNPFNGRAFYEGGMVIDAIVASGTGGAITKTGQANVLGRTYKDVVTDVLDGSSFCQWPNSPGGAWLYACQQGNDNSASQWAAIGYIAAFRGFGIPIPAMVAASNAVWASNSEAANGSWGYRGPVPVWGPYADTPSGMVQMSMDTIGRGDPRWNNSEAFYRDNFCNNPNAIPGNFPANAANAPKAYTYGMFSFTKSMLLHDPGGVLSPITNLQDSVNASPPPPIDWYSAEASGGAPCDGVARSLVDRQGLDGGYPPTPAVSTNGWWIGHTYYSGQFPYETAWSIIMLRKAVFTACVNAPYGRGTPSGLAPTRVDLTWTGIPSADHYDVLRSTVSGGPYTKVGSTAGTAFRDQNPAFPLLNGATYYYVLQPVNSAGGEICQSNEEKVKIPL